MSWLWSKSCETPSDVHHECVRPRRICCSWTQEVFTHQAAKALMNATMCCTSLTRVPSGRNTKAHPSYASPSLCTLGACLAPLALLRLCFNKTKALDNSCRVPLDFGPSVASLTVMADLRGCYRPHCCCTQWIHSVLFFWRNFYAHKSITLKTQVIN